MSIVAGFRQPTRYLLTLALATPAWAQSHPSVTVIENENFTARFPNQVEVLPYRIELSCQESDAGRMFVHTGTTDGLFRPVVQAALCTTSEKNIGSGHHTLTFSIPKAEEFKKLRMTGGTLDGHGGVQGSLEFLFVDYELPSGRHVYICNEYAQGHSSPQIDVCDGADPSMKFAIEGEELVIHWGAKDVRLPLQTLQGSEYYGTPDPTAVIEQFTQLDAEQQGREIYMFATHAIGEDEVFQSRILQTIQDWYKKNPKETSTFASALGNMASPLTLPLAERYLASSQFEDLHWGVRMIHHISNPEARAELMRVIQFAYPKAVDQRNNWGDRAAQSLVDECLRGLKWGTGPSDEEMLALQNLKAVTPGSYWRLDRFLQDPQGF